MNTAGILSCLAALSMGIIASAAEAPRVAADTSCAAAMASGAGPARFLAVVMDESARLRMRDERQGVDSPWHYMHRRGLAAVVDAVIVECGRAPRMTVQQAVREVYIRAALDRARGIP